jgi:hypothetical protein
MNIPIGEVAVKWTEIEGNNFETLENYNHDFRIKNLT